MSSSEKTAVLRLRIEPELKARFEAACAATGDVPSVAIRRMIVAYIQAVPPEPERSGS